MQLPRSEGERERERERALYVEFRGDATTSRSAVCESFVFLANLRLHPKPVSLSVVLPLCPERESVHPEKASDICFGFG